MLDTKKKNELLEQFNKAACENFLENCKELDILHFMKTENDELIRASVMKIKDNVFAAIPSGVAIPKAIVYTKLLGEGEGTIISITVMNSVNSDKKFKFKFIVSQHHIEERIKEFFVGVYSTLLEDALVEENIEYVNEIIAAAVEKAELPFAVKVTTPLNNNGRKVSFMSDDEIVFVVDEDRVFDINDIMVLQEPGGLITEEMIQDAFEHEVNSIAGAQTPEQLLEKTGGSLICYLCNLSKLVKPITYMKKITNKNVVNDRGNKDAILYYLKDGVFALIAKREGEFELLLSPVDTKTLRKVNVDVLSEIA